MKKIKSLLILLLGVFILFSCSQHKKETTQVFNDPRVKQIDSVINERNKQDLFQGQIVITEKGNVLYERNIGFAERSWNLPIDRKTKFDIASINKSMICGLVLKAVEEGKLNLTDKLKALLANYSYEGKFHPDITLHHMMSHSSGLPDYEGISEDLRMNNFIKFKRSRFSNEEYVNFISKLEPVADPEEQFYYSNFAYHLLAIILEDTYDQGLSEILFEKLTKPLGLKNTVSASKNEKIIENLANAYQFKETTNQWEETPFIDLSLGRRIFSTASDLNRWGLSMSNPGYLSESSLKLIKTNHLKEISNSISYGYGWVIVNENNKSQMGDLGIEKPYIIHGGSTDGYKSLLISINEGEFVISFLSNVGNRTDELNLGKIITHILTK